MTSRVDAAPRVPAAAMASHGRGFLPLTVAVLLGVALAGCSSSEFLLANAPTEFSRVERRIDVPYAVAGAEPSRAPDGASRGASRHVSRGEPGSKGAGADPRQRLDVYMPGGAAPGAAGGRPVVIFWYGGSWIKGSKADYRFVGTALAKLGFIAVLPDYRLYPQVTFPAFDEDGAQAVAWVERHAAEFGGDPHRIVLMGHSAGGHTAAFLALNHAFLERFGADPQDIVGLIGLSGTYAFVPDSAVLRAAFPPPFTEDDWQPLRFVDEHAPPTLLLHGLADKEVLPQEAVELHDALVRAHVRVEMQLFPHRGHADTVAPFALLARWRTPVVDEVAAFVRSVGAKPGP